MAAHTAPDAYRRAYRTIAVPALFIFAASWLPMNVPGEETRRAAAAWIEEAYRR